jgi:ComF family protein
MRRVVRPDATVDRGLMRRVVDWLLPPLCLACQRTLAMPDQLCSDCWRSTQFITQPLCDRLGIPLPYDSGGIQVSAEAIANPPDFDRARAATHFHGPARVLVHRLKYQDQLAPRRLLARWTAVAGRDVLETADVLVPVPLSRQRLLTRRFNQAALLANEIERLTGVRHASLALARRKDTPQQVGLTAAQRALNVRGAFRVPSNHKADIAGQRVVLIDDVVTTGATVNACARALKRSGAVSVDVLAVAMTTERSRTLE